MALLSPTKPQRWMLGDEFNVRSGHHESIKALWESKWKIPCGKGAYPFHDGNIRDFEKVFDFLIKQNVDDAYSDAYTEAFFPTCELLSRQAEADTASSHLSKASSLYFRIAALYRISRFPIINSDVKWKAWQAQKDAYAKAVRGWIDPIVEERIAHFAASGADKPTIPVYTRIPSKASPQHRFPTVLLITGLDGYRTDNTQRTNEFIKRGWACVIVEIPGTADCPADPQDPESPDRLWDSILGWMSRKGSFDMGNLVAWGLSCGAYYAVRVAHSHKDSLRGSVAQGVGLHYFFDRHWLDKVDNHEYPFDFNPALAQKYGFSSIEAFKEGAQRKFSLVEKGVVQKPSTRLLLINGTHDGLMPIEDSMLLLDHGSPKEARQVTPCSFWSEEWPIYFRKYSLTLFVATRRFFPKQLHMGYPFSNAPVYLWLEEVMAR